MGARRARTAGFSIGRGASSGTSSVWSETVGRRWRAGRALPARGVYLTVDELKGRVPGRRAAAPRAGSSQDTLRECRRATGLYGQTERQPRPGHSRLPQISRFIRGVRREPLRRPGGPRRPRMALRPLGRARAATTLIHVLEFLAFGVDSRTPGSGRSSPPLPSLRSALSLERLRAMRAGARLGGVQASAATLRSASTIPRPIARWMRTVLAGRRHAAPRHVRQSGGPGLPRPPSRPGIDLLGAQFTAGGEPLTPAAPRSDRGRPAPS